MDDFDDEYKKYVGWPLDGVQVFSVRNFSWHAFILHCFKVRFILYYYGIMVDKLYIFQELVDFRHEGLKGYRVLLKYAADTTERNHKYVT